MLAFDTPVAHNVAALDRQRSVQPLQHHDDRSGIAAALLTGQQLQGVPVELHGVVPGHPPAVLETQDLLQAQLRARGPERRPWTLSRNAEAPVEQGRAVSIQPWPTPWWPPRPAGTSLPGRKSSHRAQVLPLDLARYLAIRNTAHEPRNGRGGRMERVSNAGRGKRWTLQ